MNLKNTIKYGEDPTIESLMLKIDILLEENQQLAKDALEMLEDALDMLAMPAPEWAESCRKRFQSVLDK